MNKLEGIVIGKEAQDGSSQLAEVKRKSSGRARSISRLMPEVRSSIPALFDRMPAERVAEQFQVPKVDVLEEILRHTRMQLGLGPRSAMTVVRRAA